jgi:hypothetical protein
MTRRRQAIPPVPHRPTHRRDWHTLWRRCTCGLTEPCVDRRAPAAPEPFPPDTTTEFPFGSPPDTPVDTSIGRSLDAPMENDRPSGASPPSLGGYLAAVACPLYCGFSAIRGTAVWMPPPTPTRRDAPTDPPDRSSIGAATGATRTPPRRTDWRSGEIDDHNRRTARASAPTPRLGLPYLRAAVAVRRRTGATPDRVP